MSAIFPLDAANMLKLLTVGLRPNLLLCRIVPERDLLAIAEFLVHFLIE